MTATFTVTNTGCEPFTPELIGAGGRGPGGDADVQDFALYEGVVIPPGGTYAYTATRTFSAVGLHGFNVAFRAPGGAWNQIPPAPGVTNTLSMDVTDQCLPRPVVTSNVTAGPNPAPVGGAVTVTTTFKNTGCAPFTPDVIGVLARGPNEINEDPGWQNGVTLQPGESYAYSVTTRFGSVGERRFGTSYRDQLGTWLPVPAIPGVSDGTRIAVLDPRVDGSAIKVAASATVYVVYGGGAFPIPSADAFNAMGLRWDRILTVDDATLGTMPLAQPADGTLLRFWFTAPVYIVAGGAPLWIPNEEAFNRLGLNWNAVHVVPAEAQAQMPALPRDGTLLREQSTATVYRTENGARRPYTSETAFLRDAGSDAWSRVVVVPDGTLDWAGIATGEPIGDATASSTATATVDPVATATTVPATEPATEPSGRAPSEDANSDGSTPSIQATATDTPTPETTSTAAPIGATDPTGTPTSEPDLSPTAVVTGTAATETATATSESSIAPSVAGASVSSRVEHGASLVLDGDPRTAWIEGAPGTGIGESLTLDLAAPVQLDAVTVVNGVAANEVLFAAYNAVAKLQLTTDNGDAAVLTLERTCEPQTFPVDLAGARITFTILAVHPGDAFPDDTALSEVVLGPGPSATDTSVPQPTETPIQAPTTAPTLTPTAMTATEIAATAVASSPTASEEPSTVTVETDVPETATPGTAAEQTPTEAAIGAERADDLASPEATVAAASAGDAEPTQDVRAEDPAPTSTEAPTREATATPKPKRTPKAQQGASTEPATAPTRTPTATPTDAATQGAMIVSLDDQATQEPTQVATDAESETPTATSEDAEREAASGEDPKDAQSPQAPTAASEGPRIVSTGAVEADDKPAEVVLDGDTPSGTSEARSSLEPGSSQSDSEPGVQQPAGSGRLEVHRGRCPVGYSGTNPLADCHDLGVDGAPFTLTGDNGDAHTATTAIPSASGTGVAIFEDLAEGQYALSETRARAGDRAYVFCSPDRGQTILLNAPDLPATATIDIEIGETTALVCDWVTVPGEAEGSSAEPPSEEPVQVVPDVPSSAQSDAGGQVVGSGELVYGAKVNGQWDLYAHNMATGANVQLTDTSGNDEWAAAWSHDGTRLAYLSDAGGSTQVWVMDAEGGNPSQITDHAGDAEITYVAWAADDQSLIVTVATATEASLMTVPAAGGELAEFVPAWASYATVASNGAMAYVSLAGDTDIVLAGPDGVATDYLTGTTAAEDVPSFSPDGTWLAYNAGPVGARQIQIAPLGGSGRTVLTTPAGDASNPVWSPDGSAVACVVAAGGQEDIYVVPLEGDPPVRLDVVPHEKVWYLAWRP